MKNTMLEMTRYAALARQAVAEGVVLLKMRLSYRWLPAAGRPCLGTRNFTTIKAEPDPADWSM